MDRDIYDKRFNYNNRGYSDNYTKINNQYNAYFLEFLFFLSLIGSISYQIYMICCYHLKEYKKNKNLEEIILIEDSINQCSICLENFLKKEKKIIVKCSHEFHKKCIKEWLNNNNTCPLCRTEL